MWHSNRILKQFEELASLYPTRAFVVGDRVGRGFADLGYEEFVVLPSGKILSLFTGDAVPLGVEVLEHLFWIPSDEHLIGTLEQLSEKRTEVSWRAGQWELTVAGRSYHGSELCGLLLEALSEYVGSISKHEKRSREEER